MSETEWDFQGEITARLYTVAVWDCPACEQENRDVGEVDAVQCAHCDAEWFVEEKLILIEPVPPPPSADAELLQTEEENTMSGLPTGLTEHDDDRAQQVAKANMDMVMEYHRAYRVLDEEPDTPVTIDGTEYLEADDVITLVHESVLSVEARTGWATCGSEMTPEEFRICLATGGPEVVIFGDINRGGEGENARLAYRDWGTTYTTYRQEDDEEATDALEWFVGQFYFGD